MKVWIAVFTGGCYCGCSSEYCTGVDFDTRLEVYETKELAEMRLQKAISNEKYVRISDTEVRRFTDSCALTNCKDGFGNGTKDSNIIEQISIFEYDVIGI